MKLNKTLILVMSTFAVIGALTIIISLNTVSADAIPTAVTPNGSSVGMTNLTVTINMTVHNSGSHVQVFKISDLYTGNITNGPINWTIIETNPQATLMVDDVNPDGDYGWEVQPGQSLNIQFSLGAIGGFGTTPETLFFENTVPNTYWPLLSDPGLSASFFEPNELETLNPNLQIQSWIGTFGFTLKNYAENQNVIGIVRGPIIPMDSQLIYSSPQVSFLDDDYMPGSPAAAWNVNMTGGQVIDYVYTYQWPSSSNSSNGSFTSNGSLFVPGTTNNTTNSTSVPSQNTGIPVGLFVVAAGMVGAGVAYARFLR